MSVPRLAIVGCGDLGLRCGGRLLDAGWEVHGLRRSPQRLPGGFRAWQADYTEPGGLDCLAAIAPQYLLVTFNPAGAGLDGYRRGYVESAARLAERVAGLPLRRIVVVSSTRVYAETGGGWVDESSALSSADPRAVALVEMEQTLAGSGLPTTQVRCAGIYGDPHGRLLSRIAGGSICSAAPLRYGNRIHREDCGAFLAHLLQRDWQGAPLEPVYNAVDDCPAPQHEVERCIAELLGVEVSESADAGPRGAGHKRCRNHLLGASGYSLLYPDYRSGYAEVISQRESAGG